MATRNLEQAPNRAALKYWQGHDVTGFEQPPNLLNNESLLAINAAGTGTVALIKANASDQIVFGAAPAAASFTQAALEPSSTIGLSVPRLAHARYSFAVDGGVTGLITPASTAVIPALAIMIAGTVNVTGAVTSLGSATLAVGTSAGSSASSLLAATAKASLGTGVLLPIVPTIAVPVKMSAAGSITVTVGTADLTGGIVEVFVLYYTAIA